MRLFETYVILSRLVPGSIPTYTNVTITHIYAVFYIGNQDLNLNLLIYEYLEKIKICSRS